MPGPDRDDTSAAGPVPGATGVGTVPQRASAARADREPDGPRVTGAGSRAPRRSSANPRDAASGAALPHEPACVTDLVPDVDWLLQPLLAAGLGVEEIETLVCRAGLEVVVTEGVPDLRRLHEVAADRGPRVQAAWMEVISRMLG
jgi:hypothetical protein